jgi:hypothetical protein
MVNFFISKNGVKGELKHNKESLKKMYEKCYAKSDKAKSADFWEEIILPTSEKLATKRKY